MIRLYIGKIKSIAPVNVLEHIDRCDKCFGENRSQGSYPTTLVVYYNASKAFRQDKKRAVVYLLYI